jgi:hypothetical protein
MSDAHGPSEPCIDWGHERLFQMAAERSPQPLPPMMADKDSLGYARGRKFLRHSRSKSPDLFWRDDSMSIHISCPGCGEEYRVRDEAAGKSFKCKVCGKSIPIPDDDLDEFEEVERPRKKKKKRENDNSTLGPAIGLYVTGGLALALVLMNLVVSLLFGVEVPPQINIAQRGGFIAGHYAAIFILIAVDAIILTGAYSLQTCREYSKALTACILASIPCCSPLCILGMPFGIWGLVVLNNDDVKQSFS